MVRFSDRAIEITNSLHTERLDYESEYLPLIDCAQQCAAYEDTGLAPEEIQEAVTLFPREDADVPKELADMEQPKPVIVVEEDDREYIDYICPKCKVVIEQRRKGQRYGYRPKYHDECGQRLEWPSAAPKQRFQINEKGERILETKEISAHQAELMKHAIGFDGTRINDKEYTAYRNHFASSQIDREWEELINAGYARQFDSSGKYIYYKITRKGLDLLEQICGVKITED